MLQNNLLKTELLVLGVEHADDAFIVAVFYDLCVNPQVGLFLGLEITIAAETDVASLLELIVQAVGCAVLELQSEIILLEDKNTFFQVVQ